MTASMRGTVLTRHREILRGAHAVLVGEAFAEANHLQPGDTLHAVLYGRGQTFRIAGIVLSPEYVFEAPPGAALPEAVPADWLALAAERTDRTDLTAVLMGDPDPEVDEEERTRADLAGHEVVDEAIRLWA